jgi:hypothetical protein
MENVMEFLICVSGVVGEFQELGRGLEGLDVVRLNFQGFKRQQKIRFLRIQPPNHPPGFDHPLTLPRISSSSPRNPSNGLPDSNLLFSLLSPLSPREP